MKNSVFGGFTVAISFAMVSEWMQILLLVLGVISALIPVINTCINWNKGKATIDDLLDKLEDAQNEIRYLNEIYAPKERTNNA